jgi:hypothetical protein
MDGPVKLDTRMGIAVRFSVGSLRDAYSLGGDR